MAGHGSDGLAHPAHGHTGHAHGVSDDADPRYLLAALALIGAFMAAEVVVAVAADSLVLLADAGHMLTDALAIAAALWAARLAARPPSGAYTFGWKRAEILSAAGNGITLLIVAAVIVVEAVQRLVAPPATGGLPVLVMALAGGVVNLAATWSLARANRTSLNVEGAFQHILTDLYAFIGTAIAGLVILVTGFARADAIASLLVAALMIRAAAGLLRASGLVLLEASPEDLDLADIRSHLLALEHVQDVHDLHAWSLTSGQPSLSAHVVVHDSCFTDDHAPRLLEQIQECVSGHFDVDHSTFQLERARHRGDEHLVHG